MTPNRIAGAAGALVFGVLGIWGAIAAAGADQGAGVLLAGLLGTDLALAGVHLVIAGCLAAGALRGDRLARPMNVGVGLLLLVLGFVGLFVVGTPLNVLALSGVGNVLHFAAASALLATGIGAARTAAG
ncbi:DUF4383 domain-containing protein [Protaetiibacter mangrovi]|uniref:DUF4383 domain-containing protein n=1 Tax=Protaetiibacter mangrovi TaxID=2970926 RepID=A0ABT1ZH41_9MICO|nr:DUF4383 domain-containing protein [Protaetiibacter mangrovi]MCS0500029.1 DUF4383 domain-containing protein [Protaetiibacter mangrovi]